MFVEEIDRMKKQFELLKSKGIVNEWELPYENLLTRLDAAFFYANIDKAEEFNEFFNDYKNFQVVKNDEKLISELAYEISFKHE